MIPGLGDDIQAIKAGILEAGDIFVINKAEKDGADQTMSDLKTMIEMGNRQEKEEKWLAPVLKTVATSGTGIKGLMVEIDRHRKHLTKFVGDINLRKTREGAREELIELVKSRLFQEMIDCLESDNVLEDAINDIISGRKDPYTVSDELLKRKLEI